MSELVPKDPQLAGVIDKQSQRNLLDPSNPDPLEIDLSGGRPVRFGLEINNGPEGLIEIAVSADEPWLEPESTRLTLVGGEKGDVICKANPSGEAPFANLLFSWEGNDQTLCQSVMIVRSGFESGSSTSTSSNTESQDGPTTNTTSGPSPEDRVAAIETLTAFIMGCGGPDKFIDVDEENKIFRKGGALELGFNQVESLLNLKCSEGGWTRQNRLTEKLTAMLFEATKDDGVIDKQEFDHVVNFAARRKMPRRDAVEHCVTLVLDNGWKAKESMMDKWFKKLRKQYGL